ncbi:MAG: EthD family reductase [Hyphomicrobiales bacterium]|nr:EthD family reductase [Hyphomicrobiales bacterium]
MSITVTVMYPNEAGSTFDMDYYLGTHGPLVHEKWDSKGLNSLKVIKGVATPDPNTPPPYQIVAILDFESLGAFQEAVAESGAAVMGDIPNFTNVSPVVQINDNVV